MDTIGQSEHGISDKEECSAQVSVGQRRGPEPLAVTGLWGYTGVGQVPKDEIKDCNLF